MAWQYDRMSILNREAPGMQSRQGARRPAEGYYGEGDLTPDEELQLAREQQGRLQRPVPVGHSGNAPIYNQSEVSSQPMAQPRQRVIRAPQTDPRALPRSLRGGYNFTNDEENSVAGRSGLYGGSFDDGTPKPDVPRETPAPMYDESQYPVERQKIDIKFAPSQRQDIPVENALTGRGQYAAGSRVASDSDYHIADLGQARPQGPAMPRFSDPGAPAADIHEDQPGTVSNARAEFDSDIAHLHSQPPDPNDEAAMRDWHDKNQAVLSRMTRHADEARRIGNHALGDAFEAIAAGATPHEAAAIATQGSNPKGAYQAMNAQTNATREERLGKQALTKEQTERVKAAQTSLQHKADMSRTTYENVLRNYNAAERHTPGSGAQFESQLTGAQAAYETAQKAADDAGAQLSSGAADTGNGSDDAQSDKPSFDKYLPKQ